MTGRRRKCFGQYLRRGRNSTDGGPFSVWLFSGRTAGLYIRKVFTLAQSVMRGRCHDVGSRCSLGWAQTGEHVYVAEHTACC